jgi:hypothetical protein
MEKGRTTGDSLVSVYGYSSALNPYYSERRILVYEDGVLSALEPVASNFLNSSS